MQALGNNTGLIVSQLGGHCSLLESSSYQREESPSQEMSSLHSRIRIIWYMEAGAGALASWEYYVAETETQITQLKRLLDESRRLTPDASGVGWTKWRPASRELKKNARVASTFGSTTD
jgi:hypothetical protein